MKIELSVIPDSRQAFTLVELSIVIAILGLLVGAIVGGQALLRAAALRDISTKSQQYIAAVQTFRDQYGGLPGDLGNAKSYWGDAGGLCSPNDTVFTSGTCNGSSDGIILSAASSWGEAVWFWQHLSLAGLIDGKYRGYYAASGAGYYVMSDGVSPQGKISNSFWNSKPTAYDQTIYTRGADKYNALGFAAGDLRVGILPPEEAVNIDKKLDDGAASTGDVVALNTNAVVTGCVDALYSASTSANYRLTNTTAEVCRMAFFY